MHDRAEGAQGEPDDDAVRLGDDCALRGGVRHSRDMEVRTRPAGLVGGWVDAGQMRFMRNEQLADGSSVASWLQERAAAAVGVKIEEARMRGAVKGGGHRGNGRKG
jgi:hypothetical protein